MKRIFLVLVFCLMLGAGVLTIGCSSLPDDSADDSAASSGEGAQSEVSADDTSSDAKEDADAGDSSESAPESDSAETKNASSGSFAINLDELDLNCTDRDKDASYDESAAVKISLDGDSASVDESATGVAADGSTVMISQEGVYVLSGKLADGQIVVDCNKDDKAKVQLVLDGVDVSNSTGPAIRVNQAKKVFVTLSKGSKNALSDGENYELDDGSDEPYAVLYSKDDLTIQGEGSLAVNGNYRHGIAGKDDLVITGGNITVNAKEDAVRGNDCIKICGGTLDLMSGEDAIKSSNDESATSGYVLIDGGTFKINAGDDGIHAETALIINDGTIEVADSVEGIEGQQIFVNGGDIDVVASDDGVNASAGGGDGLAAQPSDGGQFGGEPPQVGEGDQRSQLDGSGGPGGEPNGVPGGELGGEPGDESSEFAQNGGFEGQPPRSPQMDQGDENVILKISGGKLHVNAGGDGLDSNGSLEVSGGETYIDGPISGGDGALDYASSATISGGILIAVGSSGMAESFTSGTQPFAMISVNGNAGSVVKVLDSSGKVLAQMTAAKEFSNAVVSAPGLEDGAECAIVVDDQEISVVPSMQGQRSMNP